MILPTKAGRQLSFRSFGNLRAAHVISCECAVAFSQRRLAHIIASEFLDAPGRGQRRERLARINLARGRDGLNPRGATHVSAGVTLLSGHRVDARVDWTGMQRNA